MGRHPNGLRVGRTRTGASPGRCLARSAPRRSKGSRERDRNAPAGTPSVILQCQTGETIGLRDFLGHLERHLDIASEESIVAMGPKLLALSRNRRFLAEYLAATL